VLAPRHPKLYERDREAFFTIVNIVAATPAATGPDPASKRSRVAEVDAVQRGGVAARFG
jgi:hypothetical protein